MRLLELTMQNFRQFLGTAELSFASADVAPVTVIHGENGVGKTTILNAIHWCFYGSTLSDFEKADQLVNDTAMARDKKANAKVEVVFSHNDTVYRVQRTYDQSKKKSSVEGFRVLRGNNTPVDGIAAVVQRIIPVHMAPYFFFHGEGLNSLGSGLGRNSFREAIRAILGFNHADKAIELMEAIKIKWQKEASRLAKLDAEGRDALEKEAEAAEAISAAERELRQSEEQLGTIESRLEELNEEIADINVQNVEELSAKRQKLEDRQREIPRRLLAVENQQIKLISRFGWSIFGYSWLSESVELLRGFRSKRKIPSEYNDLFINSILNEGACICGAELKQHSEAWNNVHALLAGASTSDQEDALTAATGIAENVQDVSDEFTKYVIRLSGERQELLEESGSISRQLEEITSRLSQIDHRKLAKLEADRQEAVGVAGRLRDHRHVCKAKLESARRAREEARRRKKKSVDESQLGAYQSKLDFLDRVMDALRVVVESEESSARTEIEQIINDRLQKFSRKDYYAEIRDDFTFELKKQDGSAVAKSKGERLLLNISFISALIQLAKSRSGRHNEYFVQGTVAPFVIDAPFGELDNEYRGAVATFLPESTEQLVVLLSSSHWGSMIESALRPSTGREYILVSESQVNAAAGKTVDRISIKGTPYECSRYGRAEAKTVIEMV